MHSHDIISVKFIAVDLPDMFHHPNNSLWPSDAYIHASVKQTITGSDNGLWSIWGQAIIWTNEPMHLGIW